MRIVYIELYSLLPSRNHKRSRFVLGVGQCNAVINNTFAFRLQISLIGIVRAMNYGSWVLQKSCKQTHMFVHKVNGGER